MKQQFIQKTKKIYRFFKINIGNRKIMINVKCNIYENTNRRQKNEKKNFTRGTQNKVDM